MLGSQTEGETTSRQTSGGALVVQALRAHGVDRVFCVPGESFLSILDALHDAADIIQLITCRHEHGAAMMAEAHGKLSGRVGVCMVTRGPGACNAAIGVHTAFQDSTPMLLLVGQVKRPYRRREAFQEVDVAAMFRPLAKHAEEIDDPKVLAERLVRAFHLAQVGRPGPVVVALPEDVLGAALSPATIIPRPVAAEAMAPGLFERLHNILGDADRPVMLLGGSGWTEAARADILAFAEANGLPTCCGFRRNDLFPNDHPNYIGELGLGANPALLARIRAADLLIAVGARLGEATSQGYTLLTVGGPEVVHVHADARELGRVVPAALAIAATPAVFARAARSLVPVNRSHWQAWAQAARADYEADQRVSVAEAAFDPGVAMAVLQADLPADAIVTVDAGNFSGWPQRCLRFGGGRRLLGPTNGAMGYGVPAAIAAKLAAPARTVVACVGDGGFGMTGQELATAVRYSADPVVLIFNNSQYGTIRMHQERAFPGRVSGTGLTNPDFAALARSYGCWADTVDRTEQFRPAFARARLAGRPAVIELRLDSDLISARTTLSSLHRTAPAATAP